MNSPLNRNRWNVGPEDFALRVTVNDLRGLLGKTLLVEPGTRAMLIADGAIDEGGPLEIPPGEYTMASFGDRLKFWESRQVTAILARMEDVPLEMQLEPLPTREGLLVEISLRLVVQMDSLPVFLHNFMGPQNSISISALNDAVRPLVQRALWEAVEAMSIEELVQAGIAGRLATAVDLCLQEAFQRYGLNFVDIQIVEARHERFDEQQQKLGEAWLIRRGMEQQDELNSLYNEQERQRLGQREHEHELRVLAARVETEALNERVNARLERIAVQNRVRETLNSEKVAELESREELKAALLEIDRQRLLRKEELDELVEGFSQRKQDRAAGRQQMLATASLQRERELAELREEISHASRLQATRHEIALAQLVATQENEAWQRELEQEAAQAEHRRRERRKKLEEQWQLISQRNDGRRHEDWQDLLHRQRSEQIETELEVARAETARRVALLEHEVEQQRADSQLDRMARLQEMNAAREQQAAELAERRAAGDSDRELRRLEVLGGLGSKALIASVNPENAALLADVEKEEVRAGSAAEREQLYERLTDAERARADAIAAVYRETMQFQQSTVDQVIQSNRPAPGGTPAGGASPQSPVEQPSRPAPSPAAEPRWWVSHGGDAAGPYSLQELQAQAAAGQLSAETFVCAIGNDTWQSAGEAVPQAVRHAPPRRPGSAEG